MYVVTTRESDGAIPALNRAEAANHVGAAACITLHATTSGSGIHLFTASLTPIPIDSLSALGDCPGRLCRAEFAALVRDRFGDDPCRNPGDPGAHSSAAVGQLHLPGGGGRDIALERLYSRDRALRPCIPGPDRGGLGRGGRAMAARLEAATVISRGQRILFWTLLISSVLMAVVLLRMRERAMDRLLASAETMPLNPPAGRPVQV